MDKNSNSYTFIYSAALVILVAAALAITAISLKKPQLKNIEIEKKQNILASVNKAGAANEAENKANYIETEYAKYITESFIVNGIGEQQEGNAFEVDMKPEADKIKEIAAKPEKAAELRKELNLPVFVCTNEDGSKKYIVPVRGMGLWGPVWGYLSFNDDFNTVYGAIFDHKGETPGLGAEISTHKFAHQFIGKKIFENGNFTSVRVVKGGAPQGDLHGVDAISGGTITSNGVSNMLYDCLGEYKAFFEKMQQEKQAQEQALQQTAEEKTENNNTAE